MFKRWQDARDYLVNTFYDRGFHRMSEVIADIESEAWFLAFLRTMEMGAEIDWEQGDEKPRS